MRLICAGLQGDVDRVPEARAFPYLRPASGRGIKGAACFVNGEEEDSGIFVKGYLDSVSVMGIEIDIGDLGCPEEAQRIGGWRSRCR